MATLLQQLRKPLEGTSSGPLLKCDGEGCGYSSNRADNFKIHLKNQHKIINCTVKRARFSCPVKECMKKYAKQLIDHLNEHKMDVGKCYKVTVSEALEFPDWPSFLEWKEREERATHTCYTKPKGIYTDGNTLFRYQHASFLFM